MASTEEIALRLRKALREERMTVDQLAKRVGYSRAQVYNYYGGRLAPPLPTLEAIAGVLNRPISYFIGGDCKPAGKLAVLLAEAEEYPETLQEHIASVVREIIEFERQRAG